MVSSVTYLAGQSRGLLAAFVANLPIITLITFLTVYYEFGREAVLAYAKGLVIMLGPWLAYIGSVIFLSRRMGVVPSLLTGLVLYFLLSFIIIYLKRS
jgi:hypothetical protein